MRILLINALSISFMFTGGCSRGQQPTLPAEPASSALFSPPQKGEIDWLSIAEADVIIRTRVDYPGEPVKKLWKYDIENYRIAQMPALDVLKCDATNPWSFNPAFIRKENMTGRSVRVPFYAGETAPGAKDTDKARLEHFHNQEVILLLQFTGDGDSPSSKRYPFLSYIDPILPWSKRTAEFIKEEVARQKQLAEQVRKYLVTRPVPLEDQVRQCVEDLMRPDRYSNKQRDEAISRKFQGDQNQIAPRMTYPEPLARLEELGMDAVPAIMKHLDDPRSLPKGGTKVMLDIHDHPNAWEGVYHTSANTITEVLLLALQQITIAGPIILRGDPERTRKNISSWRLWMVHSGMLAGMTSGKTPSQSVPPPSRLLEPGTKPAVYGNQAVM